MSQRWDPGSYERDARYVSDYGMAVVELLDPRPGERILGLGCGDGALTRRIMERGCEVVGVDCSAEMVEAARALGVDARVMDGHDLAFASEFDAVFSNAALHWMRRPERVVSGVVRALKPGGRYVGEFGGHGNIRSVVRGIKDALAKRGTDFEAVNPWYFPTAEEYRTLLETFGLRVLTCSLFPRPTPLPTDLAGWLRVFGRAFLDILPESEQEPLIKKVPLRCLSSSPHRACMG